MAQIAFWGPESRNRESRNQERESGGAPSSPAPRHPLPRLSARVVLALRATTKRGTSDAPGELASISVAAPLFVSRVGELSCPAREAATKVAMRCGARGETHAQAPGRRRASRLRSNPPRRGRRSWSRVAPYVRVMGWTPPGTDPTKPRFFGSFRRRSPLCGFRRWPQDWRREERSRACPRPEGSRV